MTCERCDRAFGCGVRDASCWCSAVDVPAEARDRLASAYAGCLCPDCLRELAGDAGADLPSPGADEGRLPTR